MFVTRTKSAYAIQLHDSANAKLVLHFFKQNTYQLQVHSSAASKPMEVHICAYIRTYRMSSVGGFSLFLFS